MLASKKLTNVILIKIACAVSVAFALLYFLVPQLSLAATYPSYQGYVTDTARLLDQSTRQSLEQKLAQYDQTTTNQIAVLTITSLAGEPIENYAVKVFERWKIGQVGKDNGVLFLVAKDDRQMRIEVGYGLEGSLTDGAAGAIIRNVVAPRFRENDYPGGIIQGVEAIIAELQDGTESEVDVALGNNPLRQIGGQQIDNLLKQFGDFIVFIPMMFVYLLSYMARTKDVTLGGIVGGIGGALVGLLFGISWVVFIAGLVGAVVGLLFDWILSRNYKALAAQGKNTDWFHTYGGFGGSRGFGGGGFGGFGGGRSGGGGSSGGW